MHVERAIAGKAPLAFVVKELDKRPVHLLSCKRTAPVHVCGARKPLTGIPKLVEWQADHPPSHLLDDCAATLREHGLDVGAASLPEGAVMVDAQDAQVLILLDSKLILRLQNRPHRLPAERTTSPRLEDRKVRPVRLHRARLVVALAVGCTAP